jgi:hypothetical protein
VQAQLTELQSSQQAGQQEVRAQLQEKTREAAELRSELERVHARMLEVERFGGSDAGSSVVNLSLNAADGVQDHHSPGGGSTLSTSRLSFTADGLVDLSPELLDLIKEIGLPHAEGCLSELGVSLVSDLEYVTDSELEHSGLRPVHWRKLRTAAAQYLGLDDGGDGIVDDETRQERRRRFLAATASPRSSPVTVAGASAGATRSLEKRRSPSRSPPVRLPPQVVPVATTSPPSEQTVGVGGDAAGRSSRGKGAGGKGSHRRPPPPPKVSQPNQSTN